MVLRFLRHCIAAAAVTAYVGLAVGGHALHDVTCDHDHPPLAAGLPATAGCDQHGHHHHHHHGHPHAHDTACEQRPGTHSPHGNHDHHHPSQPRHDHDCLICHFAATTVAVMADAVELPETPGHAAPSTAAAPLATISRPFSGNPRAPPA